MARREGKEAALAYDNDVPECISQKTYKDPCKNCGCFIVFGEPLEWTDSGKGRGLFYIFRVTEAMVNESSPFRFLKAMHLDGDR